MKQSFGYVCETAYDYTALVAKWSCLSEDQDMDFDELDSRMAEIEQVLQQYEQRNHHACRNPL